MKEIIEKAEKLGYIKYFFNEFNGYLHQKATYIELCLIQKWIYEKFGIWIEVYQANFK